MLEFFIVIYVMIIAGCYIGINIDLDKNIFMNSFMKMCVSIFWPVLISFLLVDYLIKK